MSTILFPLGQTVATPGALQALSKNGQSPAEFIQRHHAGDWGDLCPEDAAENNRSLRDGERLLSVYHLLDGEKIYLITEHDRSVTTVLLPEEY
jgi:hypothetical protein